MADTESEITAMVSAGDWRGLVRALVAKDSKMRREAAFGLAELGDARAVEEVVRALDDERPVRARARSSRPSQRLSLNPKSSSGSWGK